MNILNTTTASTRIPERIIGFTRVPTDPTNILFFFVVIEPAGQRIQIFTCHLVRRQPWGRRCRRRWRRIDRIGGGAFRRRISTTATIVRRRHRRCDLHQRLIWFVSPRVFLEIVTMRWSCGLVQREDQQNRGPRTSVYLLLFLFYPSKFVIYTRLLFFPIIFIPFYFI